MKQIIISIAVLVFLVIAEHAFAQDTTCGIVWDEPILLSDTAYDAYSPKIALSGDDTVHVTWESEKPGLRLPYRRSTTAGLNFDLTRDVLTDSVQYPYRTSWNHVLAEGNRVYVFSGYYATSAEPLLMHISTDYGMTWSKTRSITDSVGIPQSVALHQDTLAIVYYPGIRHILRSTDAGATWTKTTENLNVFSQVALTRGALHLVHEAEVNSTPEIMYRLSHDLGTTWDQTTLLSDSDQIYSDVPIIAAGDSTVITAWRDEKYGCLGILGCSIASRTGIVSNDSTRWMDEEILTDAPRGYPQAISINGKRHIVAWEDELVPNQVFHTAIKISRSNSRTTWCPIIDVTPNYNREVVTIDVAVTDKAVHVVWSQSDAPSPSTFRIYYRRGVFMQTDVLEQQETLPKEISLSQNYPNPFNPFTIVNYQLPIDNYVTLKVYDVFGREVATLVNEKMEAGEHEVEWAASNIASGVYYYRLLATDSYGKTTMQTKKMIMIR